MALTLTGLEAVTQRLQQLAQPSMPVLGAALTTEGNRIMNESVRLVPVRTGLLRSTAAVLAPVVTGTSVSVELRYGGFGLAPYASLVHYDISMYHPHGQSHYLDQPLFAAVAGFTGRIAGDLRSALGLT